MLNRLIGMETEYATMVRPPADQQALPSRQCVYRALCEAIGRRMPMAPSRFSPHTFFLANGGALSIETDLTRLDEPGGLFEGASPEATSPARLLECQRAQDRLIAAAAADCRLPVQVRILKNGSDAEGHVYGCQENYAAPVASGLGLLAFRLGLLLLYPPVQIASLVVLGLLLALVVAPLATWRWARARWRGERRRLSESVGPIPKWLIRGASGILRIAVAPLVGLFWLNAWAFAFRPHRRYLTAFLISRVALTGSGHLDPRGRFRLSSKALEINSVLGAGNYMGGRPIYVLGHWISKLWGESLLSWTSFTEMFRQQQRLQIGIGDSNIADTAEYLKVGATALVLDMIEAGGGRDLPRLRRPIAALHTIACDWNLISRVPTSRGSMSALEIQEAYLRACRRYVARFGEAAPVEAQAILIRWERALEALRAFRSHEIDFRPGLGHIDWLTKKWMLDQLDPKLSWAVRKKIDLRYHELSPDGYYRRVADALPDRTFTDEQAIERALRLPPANSPATRRGQLIREFANGDQNLELTWSHAVIGAGKARHVVPLHDA